MGNKMLLVMLWDMYPNHPLLLPAYINSRSIPSNWKSSKKWVSKPVFGREGAGVYVSSNFSSWAAFESATNRAFGSGSSRGSSIYQ